MTDDSPSSGEVWLTRPTGQQYRDNVDIVRVLDAEPNFDEFEGDVTHFGGATIHVDIMMSNHHDPSEIDDTVFKHEDVFETKLMEDDDD